MTVSSLHLIFGRLKLLSDTNIFFISFVWKNVMSEFWGQISEFWGRSSELRGQRIYLWCQSSELRRQTSEFWGQTSEFWGQSSELRGQSSELISQRIYLWGQRVHLRGQLIESWGEKNRCKLVSSLHLPCYEKSNLKNIAILLVLFWHFFRSSKRALRYKYPAEYHTNLRCLLSGRSWQSVL